MQIPVSHRHCLREMHIIITLFVCNKQVYEQVYDIVDRTYKAHRALTVALIKYLNKKY